MLIKDKPLNIISSSVEMSDTFREVFSMLLEEDRHREVFYVAGLDSRNRVLYIDLVTLGTVNTASPVIRETLRQGIIRNAVSVIVCHNHPSGKTQPSREDDEFTRKLNEACELLGIKLLDHIILGDDVYSYADNGKL